MYMEIKTLLLVEDEPLIQKVYKTHLEKIGYRVLTGNNGKEGLQQAKSEHPDLILLDILMPIMDGMTMLQELRKDAWGKTARVLVLTNLSMEEDNEYVKTYGALGFLIKADHSLAEVTEEIEKYLK